MVEACRIGLVVMAALASGCVFDRSGLSSGDSGTRDSAADARVADLGDAFAVDLPPVTDSSDGAVDGTTPDLPDSAVDGTTPDLLDSAVDLPWCGNGFIEAGEQCDDKNTSGGDGCSSACQVEPFHADLVAYWPMDESTGSTAADSVGNHDGALQNMSSAAWVNGKLNNALQFDGNNDYVDVGSIGAYDDLTIALWVNAASITKSYHSLFHSDGWSSGDVHFMILSDGRVRFSLNGNSATDRDSSFTFSNELQKWHHVAVVYRRNAKTVDFYIDGTFDVQRTYSTTRSADLGARRIGAWDGGSRELHGMLDDLRIYRLDEQQVDAGVAALLAARVVSSLGNCHDQTTVARIIGSQLSGHLAPVHERQIQVQQHDVGILCRSDSYDGVAIRGRDGCTRSVAHQPDERVGRTHFLVDN